MKRTIQRMLEECQFALSKGLVMESEVERMHIPKKWKKFRRFANMTYYLVPATDLVVITPLDNKKVKMRVSRLVTMTAPKKRNK